MQHLANGLLNQAYPLAKTLYKALRNHVDIFYVVRKRRDRNQVVLVITNVRLKRISSRIRAGGMASIDPRQRAEPPQPPA